MSRLRSIHGPARPARLGAAVVCVVLALGAGVAGAQPRLPSAEPEPQPQVDDPREEMDEVVADALVQRAKLLLARKDHGSAKMLLIESLERSPSGPTAEEARDLLRYANKKLGLDNLDDGAPPAAGSPAGGGSADQPLDPYGAAGPDGVGEEPMDPYGEVAAEAPLDPYGSYGEPVGDSVAGASGQGERVVDVELPPAKDTAGGAQRAMVLWGGLAGMSAGMALAGPTSDSGSLEGSSILVGLLGAGAGAGIAHLASRNRSLTDGRGAAIAWSGAWGGAAFGFLADVVTGIDASDSNDIFRGMALGTLTGTAAGILITRRAEPSAGDVALTSSLGLYGTAGGLLLGLALDPRESEAYSINGLLGAAAGLGTGLLAARRLDVSRRRMLWVDAGAAVGAATPWVLIYPLMSGEDSAAQVAGLTSTLGLVGGALIAWRLTRDMDRQERIGRMRIAEAPVPGLVQRGSDGRWRLGGLWLRPARLPHLAPSSSGPGVAVDVVSGRF